MSFLAELKRRNVLRVGAAYIVVAWLVIQVVETIFPAFGFGDSAIRVVVIGFAIGLVPVLIISWIFELTPEGFKREGEVDRSRPFAPTNARKLDRAIIVVLTLALGFFAFDKFVLEPAREAESEKVITERVRSQTLVDSYGDSSIAVLPFVNMSDDAGNEYFSDGISEELLHLLANIPRLRVTSQSSSFSFKGKDISIPEIAERLNVGFVLEGSVRKFGNKLRITAQLIEARSDTHLWSETYDRTVDDLFAIQDEISAAIVAAAMERLKLDLGTAPRVTVVSSEAHDAVLRGRYLVAQRTRDAKKAAVAEFEKALSLDAEYAPAQAELALALFLGGCGDITTSQCIAIAAPHVEKALALVPGLDTAHAAKATLLLRAGKNEEALAHFRRAIEINPSYSEVYVWMAIEGLLPSHEEAFAARETAMRLDPLSRMVNVSYISALLYRNRLAEASQQIEKYALIDPSIAMIARGVRTSVGGNWANYILAYLEAANAGTGELAWAGSMAAEMMWHLAAIGLPEEALRFYRGESARENVLAQSLLGNPGDGLELARAQLAADPQDLKVRADMGLVLAYLGRYPEARPYLEERWQEWNRSVVDFPWSWFLGYDAQALFAARSDAGDLAGANQVLAEFKDIVRGFRDAGMTLTQWNTSVDYEEGMAAWLSGDRDRGLTLISKAVEDGFWLAPPAAFQQAMYQDPGFAPILEIQEARQTRERIKVLAVVCNNNPYTAVWQPTEETCERYFSAWTEHLN